MTNKPELTLDRVSMITVPPEKSAYSPYGYIVQADGTTYALSYAYYHGIVLALLYPDKLAEYTPDEPIQVWNEEKDDYDVFTKLTINPDREENNVFKFQRFQFWLERQKDLESIRIATGRAASQFCIDKPKKGCTPEQVEAVRLIIKEIGLGPRDEVIAEHADMKVKDLWDYLPKPDSLYDLPEVEDDENA